MKRSVISLVLLALLSACSSMPEVLQGEKIQYKGAAKLPGLDIPPDLTSPSRDDRYAVPDVNAQGAATLSTYNAARGSTVRAGSTELLPNVAKVRIERSGNQRWLVVPEAPEKVWPIVREFWQGVGFVVKTELPEAGVMETDWAENRAKLADDPIRNLLGKVIDAVYSTGERDKFRTRLERGTETGTTEIYVSHRGMVEVYKSESKDASTAWQPRPPDPELEAEFLRRLMVRFGVEDARAKAQLTSSEVKTERAKLVRAGTGPGAGNGSLELSESFDRAWRRVGLALDRVGFTVEDRDRSKGYYFVRYVDPQIDGQSPEKDKGFLSKLAFWKSEKSSIKAEQYRVVVKETKGLSEVQVQNKDGLQDSSDTGRRILTLLHEQLK